MDERHIGQRLREIRSWRQLSLRAVAELSGITFGYLAQLERGEKPVTNRRVLEALAQSLRVSPVELTGKPWAPVDPVGSDAHAVLVAIETALASYELGTDPGGPARPWPALAADLTRLTELRYVHYDYAAQGSLVPRLLAELHATYVRHPQHRENALRGLIHCYSSAYGVTKALGGQGLPLLATAMAQQCAEELSEPQWLAYATFLRGNAIGPLNRPLQYVRSVRMAEELSGHLDDSDVLQMYGMLHLSAALAAAAQADRDTAFTHLAEATTIADRLDAEVGTFAKLWFGRTNVGIWRVSLAVEFKDGPKVGEFARDVHPELIPAPGRQATFWCDLGRSMLAESGTRDTGLTLLLRAEKLAPQRVRNDVFVREAVADQLRLARRDAGSRELRGLAWRMGVAPNG